MRYSSSTGGGDRGSVMWRSVEWARWVLNDRNPCRYCWEWGHWVNDCHLKKACKPPLGDPRHLNPNYCLKKSANCHPACSTIRECLVLIVLEETW